MMLTKAKYLTFFAALLFSFSASAAIVYKDVEKWSGGGKSLTSAVNGAKETDTTIIRLKNDLTINSDLEVRGGTAGKIKKIIASVKSVGYPVEFKDKKSIFDDSKIESHSALTPTYKIPDKNRLSEDEMKVYSAIIRRFVAVFCAEE